MSTTSLDLANLIKAKLTSVSSFSSWVVDLRRREELLAITQFPAIIIIAMEPEELTIDTDNRSEIGYSYGVILAYKDEVTQRANEGNKLPDWVRLAQQSVYTTDYPGFIIEDIQLFSKTGLDLKGLRENCLVSDFLIQLSVMEDRT